MLLHTDTRVSMPANSPRWHCMRVCMFFAQTRNRAGIMVVIWTISACSSHNFHRSELRYDLSNWPNLKVRGIIMSWTFCNIWQRVESTLMILWNDMRYFIYWTAEVKSSKLWSSRLRMQFMQLRREVWKIQCLYSSVGQSVAHAPLSWGHGFKPRWSPEFFRPLYAITHWNCVINAFPSKGFPIWRVKSSGVRQSKIYKCSERSCGSYGVKCHDHSLLVNDLLMISNVILFEQ